ncbi:MAG: serine/threonine protein kinase, partial [Candidatus Sericytochromatia bacterium]
LVYLLSGREPADLPQHDLLLNFRPYVECSERFALWIEHLILPAPEQRFRSAAEALEILQDILPAYRSLSLPAIQKETARAVHVNWSALEREARNAGPEADVPTSEWLSPGSELEARYRIAGVLGQGDIAITYAAERIGDGKPVVIRELHFDKLTHWKSYELFEREFRALSKLEHPALPRLIDHFEQRQDERHRFYLVSERIGGRTLDSKLRQGWRPAEKEVRAIAEQLLKIIAFLQDQDPPLIHRDIKPSNILIDEADRVYLIDFGAVQEAFRLQGGGGSTVIGTYGYMAPEQCVGKAVPASDLYGLGATLIHLLSGHAPAELPHQELKIQFADQVRCSRPLFRWLEKLVAPRLDQRFDSPGHALEILLKLDRMPVGSDQLQARESEILDKNDSAIAIIEDTEGLQLQLRPVLHDYKLLLPLILGSNLAIVPLMITASPMLGFTLAIVLPYLSGLLMFRLKQKGEQYETLINIDPDGFNYCVLRKDPEGETEVLEKLYHPIASVADLFLDQSNVHNRLGLRLQTEGRQAYLMLVTQYPLAANRRRAEYLIERMREALSYYRRQIGMR